MHSLFRRIKPSLIPNRIGRDVLAFSALFDLLTLTDGGVLVGSGTGAITPLGLGTAGQVLTSNGAGSDPSMQAVSGGGQWEFVSKVEASGSATIDIVLATADEYKIVGYGVHGSAQAYLYYSFSIDAGTNWTAPVTTVAILSENDEADANLAHSTWTNASYGEDTGDKFMSGLLGTDNDHNNQFEMRISRPGDTTFMKNFSIRTVGIQDAATDKVSHIQVEGYINTTSAVDKVRFKKSTGNIDVGTFILYKLVVA